MNDFLCKNGVFAKNIKSQLLFVFVVLLILLFQNCSNQKSKETVSAIDDSAKVKSLDTVALAKKLFNDIDKLLEVKDSLLINQTIFGDCIYEQLDINDPDPIRRSDIMRNFNHIFDEKFRANLHNLKMASSIEYEYLIHNGSSLRLDCCECQYVATVGVVVTFDAFSRTYWFCFNGDNWIFTGITGVG